MIDYYLQLNSSENPEKAREQFHATIENVLLGTLLIEKSHQEAVNRFISQVCLYVSQTVHENRGLPA